MRDHRNNIGIVRLLLSGCVIIGHAPEILDGNRHREPLTTIFHTVSLGDLAVDAFFALSGFLITSSLLRGGNIKNYLINRIARIYPAFLICFIICTFVLVPLVGGHPLTNIGWTITNAITLHPPPSYKGELSGLALPVINGAMWSISYEFRCYLLVAALFSLGLLNKRWVIAFFLLVLVILVCFSAAGRIPGSYDTWIPKGDWAFGTPQLDVRLLSLFFAGSCVYLFRYEFHRYVTGYVTMAALAIMVAGLRSKELADLAASVFGVVVLFWFCLKANIGFLQRLNDRWDISYGTYLYGWPAAVTLVFFWRSIDPLKLALISLVIALSAGALSWFALELHVQSFVKRLKAYR